MSYVPEDQRLDEVVDRLKDALREVDTRARNRLGDSDEWKEDHREKLIQLRQQISNLEAVLFSMF